VSVSDFSEIEKMAYAEIYTENMMSRNMGVTIKIFIRMGIGYTVLGVHIVCDAKVKQIQWVQCR